MKDQDPSIALFWLNLALQRHVRDKILRLIGQWLAGTTRLPIPRGVKFLPVPVAENLKLKSVEQNEEIEN